MHNCSEDIHNTSISMHTCTEWITALFLVRYLLDMVLKTRWQTVYMYSYAYSSMFSLDTSIYYKHKHKNNFFCCFCLCSCLCCAIPHHCVIVLCICCSEHHGIYIAQLFSSCFPSCFFRKSIFNKVNFDFDIIPVSFLVSTRKLGLKLFFLLFGPIMHVSGML